ncbi:serine protease [Mesorhizobium sp. ES1-6]|uniref:serine protease n=1 Tax=Mesorhizobium sp. ES1-6 TaxID=2876626 RepID=UPI001CC93457|nr:serine protease [Mesorhizobium sp. ES1-6]MBZ9801097.1 serine protease [Mesorhizobium sp. ES1-6]
MAKKTVPARKRKAVVAASLSADETQNVYSSRRFLDVATQKKLGLRIRFDTYYKDPLIAKNNPGVEIDGDFYVPWEPRIGAGPTSARFAVVDYDSTTNRLEKPAEWSRKEKAFLDPDGRKIDRTQKETAHFRQVSTWAILQNTLDFFESPSGLGRRVSWAFEGSRLLVTPNAGYGANAYYDRESKSLQFYYFDDEDGHRIHTCLSSDIVNHEFGHALLDAIRPYYLEAVSPQTGAFHEFLGDLTAILMTLRNSSFRGELAARTDGDLRTKSGEDLLAAVAAEFGNAVSRQPYLRSAANRYRLGKFKNEIEPHTLSQVMTGAMFDIFVALTEQYLKRERSNGKTHSPLQSLQYAAARMQVIAIQALDLLPPVEVSFNDYARAVLRNLAIADPTDPKQYRAMIAGIFGDREIMTAQESTELLTPAPLYDRMPGTISHDPELIGSSRAEAYRYLDDNRDKLFIPDHVDLIVDEVFTSEKMVGSGLFQPKQIILQYLWREELVLRGSRFGAFNGKITSLLCGGTMVLDVNGSLLYWVRKPGSGPSATAVLAKDKRARGKTLFGTEEQALAEVERGKERKRDYLEALARRIEEGMVGEELAGPDGIAGNLTPPLIARQGGGSVTFELSPHFHIHDHDETSLGGLRWQMSS